jgi:hypothetical protein
VAPGGRRAGPANDDTTTSSSWSKSTAASSTWIKPVRCASVTSDYGTSPCSSTHGVPRLCRRQSLQARPSCSALRTLSTGHRGAA